MTYAILKYFLPFYGLPFYFADGVFDAQIFTIFIKPN